MAYLDPVDTHTLRKVGINMAVLVGVALALVVLAMAIV